MADDIQELVSDDMSRSRRAAAIRAMTDDLATEDIEAVNMAFPRLAVCAYNEILNHGGHLC